MTDQKRNKPLHLDMDWAEALQRFVQTDPGDLPDNKKLRPRRKTEKAGSRKPPAGKRKDGGT